MNSSWSSIRKRVIIVFWKLISKLFNLMFICFEAYQNFDSRIFKGNRNWFRLEGEIYLCSDFIILSFELKMCYDMTMFRGVFKETSFSCLFFKKKEKKHRKTLCSQCFIRVTDMHASVEKNQTFGISCFFVNWTMENFKVSKLYPKRKPSSEAVDFSCYSVLHKLPLGMKITYQTRY